MAEKSWSALLNLLAAMVREIIWDGSADGRDPLLCANAVTISSSKAVIFGENLPGC
jgi:hypothetical protein